MLEENLILTNSLKNSDLIFSDHSLESSQDYDQSVEESLEFRSNMALIDQVNDVNYVQSIAKSIMGKKPVLFVTLKSFVQARKNLGALATLNEIYQEIGRIQGIDSETNKHIRFVQNSDCETNIFAGTSYAIFKNQTIFSNSGFVKSVQNLSLNNEITIAHESGHFLQKKIYPRFITRHQSESFADAFAFGWIYQKYGYKQALKSLSRRLWTLVSLPKLPGQPYSKFFDSNVEKGNYCTFLAQTAMLNLVRNEKTKPICGASLALNALICMEKSCLSDQELKAVGLGYVPDKITSLEIWPYLQNIITYKSNNINNRSCLEVKSVPQQILQDRCSFNALNRLACWRAFWIKKGQTINSEQQFKAIKFLQDRFNREVLGKTVFL